MSLSHAHGSSRFWEQRVHPAPPVPSKRSINALHPAADRSDEVLQPAAPSALQFGLVVPLHWLDAADTARAARAAAAGARGACSPCGVAAPAPSPASSASSSAEGLRQSELTGLIEQSETLVALRRGFARY